MGECMIRTRDPALYNTSPDIEPGCMRKIALQTVQYERIRSLDESPLYDLLSREGELARISLRCLPRLYAA